MITLHLPAVPHVKTSAEWSHCAFGGGKVRLMAPMMRSVGYRVVHYGVEGSESGADEDVVLLSHDEWTRLRAESFKYLFPDRPPPGPTDFVGELSRWDTPLYGEFNRRLRAELTARYKPGDIVLLPFGRAHNAALQGLRLLAVESGIGYNEPFADFRIYESFAWYHYHLGREGATVGRNYHFVVPNYYDPEEWPAGPGADAGRPKVGFLGRICEVKGMPTLVEVARRCPGVDFIICGQGDPDPWLHGSPNIVYREPIHGRERARYLGGLTALLAPSAFVEPFCGVAAEAQLVGTPVLGPAYGALTETVLEGKTGFHCHTLQDYVEAIRKAAGLDRAAIRDWALERFSMYNVARKYDVVLRTVREVETGEGWYGSTSFLQGDLV